MNSTISWNPGEDEPASPLDPWVGPTDICVWVTNQQTHPNGVALQLRIEIELTVPDQNAESGEAIQPFTLDIYYLEPNRLLKYRLASIDDGIPFIRGEIRAIRYYDLLQRRLHFGHGSGSFSQHPESLVNSRKIFYGDEEY